LRCHGLARGAPRSIRRLLDANANRALEGLRVCEDIVRFHYGAAALFGRMRALRHDTAGAVTALPLAPIELAQARQSRQDVGRAAPSAGVASLDHLLILNFQRVKESLRALEECARVIAPRHARVFQRLRFRTYEVERDTLLRVAALRHH
jgi:thiamine-phosphate pyrophosphorylase